MTENGRESRASGAENCRGRIKKKIKENSRENVGKRRFLPGNVLTNVLICFIVFL
jgi:hypothetical protein